MLVLKHDRRVKIHDTDTLSNAHYIQTAHHHKNLRGRCDRSGCSKKRGVENKMNRALGHLCAHIG